MLIRFLTFLFGAPEEINGHGRCPTAIYRWGVASLFGRKCYLHRFVGSDWSLDLHDHPKRFVSIGLRGRYQEEYEEERPCASSPARPGLLLVRRSREYRAPWVRTFPAEWRHRIVTQPGEECWTLVLVGKAVRDWGFWHWGRFIPWQRFVEGNLADAVKSCP